MTIDQIEGNKMEGEDGERKKNKSSKDPVSNLRVE